MIEQITANDFVDVKDIKGMFLYTKSNKIFSYLRIYPFNLDLLTTEDRRNLTNRLAGAFVCARKQFFYFLTKKHHLPIVTDNHIF